MKLKLSNTDEPCFIDADQLEMLSKYHWYRSPQGYAVAHGYGRKAPTTLMHRLVNNTPEGYQTDHINRNKLDNRRSNLRTCTIQTNRFNQDIYKTNTSGATGVTKFRGKFRARISAGGREFHLGVFDTFDEAVAVRIEARERLHVFS